MDEYDRTNCPHCGAQFDPMPRAKKRCPSCRQQVWVRSGPDGRRYILRGADLAAHEARWETFNEALADAQARRLNLEAARLTREALRAYSKAGVHRVQMCGASDPCPSCAAVANRLFALSAVPPIPVFGCSNEICRCDYLPVVE
jgi:rubrerythrin